ncbi:MAG: hypothetical protein GXY44_11295 [Phycisphaerales bacterium]|nr:hypothetical protein [Phycisphaerales bacterium]
MWACIANHCLGTGVLTQSIPPSLSPSSTVLYWSIVSLLLGACIGSFLNVVIYRWPRDLSIRRPSRSFCPACRQAIIWYDNIPVLSYFLLGGRCRGCKTRISLQYPLVELATAFVFLLVYDAFFISRQRLGISELANDWPMLLGHWALFAGLIALAVMDLEAYMVDIRVTWLITAAGALAHLFWTPASSTDWLRPGMPLAGWSAAVVVGLLVGAWLFLREPITSETAVLSDEPVPPEEKLTGSPGPLAWLGLLMAVGLAAAYVVALTIAGSPDAPAGAPLVSPGYAETARLVGGLAFLFVALAILASHPQPAADAEIIEEITEGASGARRNALAEMKLLSPAIILGAAWLLLIHYVPMVKACFDSAMHWQPLGDWQPLCGLSTAIAGWVIGGLIGWATRIIFTLLFGKEALGMGDVHILAAAGAVASWPVSFLGFFLAAPLTLLAMIVIHLRRQSRALPFGPWLGLGFLLAAVFADRILVYLNLR